MVARDRARSRLVRNGSVAIANGLVTLVILLIAPLGLAAVLVTTLMVTLTSFGVTAIADLLTNFTRSRPSDYQFRDSPYESLEQPNHSTDTLERRDHY